jgi:disulfide bond formation protein DsbB
MDFTSQRSLNLIAFFICAGLLAYAFYTQFYAGLEPCPLCILQRTVMFVLGGVFLLAAVHHPHKWGGRLYAALIALTALTGAVISARHVWLQNLPPDQMPECGPSLSYMLDVFPLTETLRMVFMGSGECASIDWMFLGLSMPAWVLLWFVLLGMTGVLVNWRPRA